MAGKPGSPSVLPTKLPAKYERLFAWGLHRRCRLARQIAADLSDLWTDLGGVEGLSAQQRWLVERAIFMRRQMLEWETATFENRPTTLTAGEYSNIANVFLGHLKTLGIHRRATRVGALAEYLAKGTAA